MVPYEVAIIHSSSLKEEFDDEIVRDVGFLST
jgi:hypothetical protein